MDCSTLLIFYKTAFWVLFVIAAGALYWTRREAAKLERKLDELILNKADRE